MSCDPDSGSPFQSRTQRVSLGEIGRTPAVAIMYALHSEINRPIPVPDQSTHKSRQGLPTPTYRCRRGEFGRGEMHKTRPGIVIRLPRSGVALDWMEGRASFSRVSVGCRWKSAIAVCAGEDSKSPKHPTGWGVRNRNQALATNRAVGFGFGF